MILTSAKLSGQAVYTGFEYKIWFYNPDPAKVSEISSLLSRYSNSSAITYNAADSSFSIRSVAELDKKVLTGKMQKNFFAAAEIIRVGELPEPFPKLVKTGNDQADEENYAALKKEWIEKYPRVYREITRNPQKYTLPQK